MAIALSAPFAGMIAETFNRKTLIIFSLFAIATATLLTATAYDLELILVWRFIQGVFVSAVITSTTALIHEQFYLFRDGDKTVGLALWAKCNEEAERKLKN